MSRFYNRIMLSAANKCKMCNVQNIIEATYDLTVILPLLEVATDPDEIHRLKNEIANACREIIKKVEE